MNDFVKILLQSPEEEKVLLEYSSSDNAYFRKVKAGRGDELIQRFEVRLKAAKTRAEIFVVLGDIDDALEDCGYTEEHRKGERAGNYAAAGALGGALIADRRDAAGGALLGAGIGLIAAHLIKDDGEDVIKEHVRELKRLKAKANDRLVK